MTVKTVPGPTDTASVIEVDGEIDMYTFKEFQREINTQLDGGKTHVLLDFSGVDYLDSSGVGAIVRMLQKAREKKAALGVAGLHGSPLKILHLSHVLTLLPQYTKDAAGAFFRG